MEDYNFDVPPSLVGKLIEQVGIRIQNGECSLSAGEMVSLLRMVLHERWYLPRLEHEFNVSQRTIERWCKDGLLPPLRTDDTGHKYLWHDEVEIWKLSHRLPSKGSDS